MLEKYLLLFYPDKYIKQYIATPKVIFENRILLRNIRFTSQSFRNLVQAVIDAIEDKNKIRTLHRLIILKSILYSNREVELEKDVIDMLFHLFRLYIFSQGTSLNVEISRQANNLIRNQPLDETQILWLIENYKRSGHILNRLLRYPGVNENVVNWARTLYEQNELPERRAEVVGLLISDTLPELCINEDVNMVLWAIYYSRNSPAIKRKLLLSVVNRDNIESCIDGIYTIAERIGSLDIVEELLQDYC